MTQPQRTVLDIGNCSPDHAAISRMLTRQFGANVLQADNADDAFPLLRSQAVDLVLINRKLDCDYSDGIEVLKQIKADPNVAAVPVMLVTNYQEHQQAAVALGALYGFGKLELNDKATLDRLREVLQPEATQHE